MKKSLLATSALIAFPAIALAQSSPNLTFGQVPTAGQWNGFFAAKQDLLAYTPYNQAGGPVTGNMIVNGQALFSFTSTPTATCTGTNLPGGTGTITISGTNQSGLLTMGTGTTSICTVTFSPASGTAFSSCVISPANTTAASSGSAGAWVSGTSLTTTNFSLFSVGSALANKAYMYQCF